MTRPWYDPATGRWVLPGDRPPPSGAPRRRSPAARLDPQPPARPPAVPPVPRPVPLVTGRAQPSARPPRSATWRWALAVVAAFLVGLAVPVGAGSRAPEVSEAASGTATGGLLDASALIGRPTVYALEIVTSGVSRVASVRWDDGQGGVEVREDRATPFRQTVAVGTDRPWTTVRVTARLAGDARADASVTCVISDDVGRVLDMRTRRGDRAEATCSSTGR